MKKAAVKKLTAALLIVSLLVVSFQSVAQAAPCTTAGNTCPYFKTYGGDIMSGGWIKSGNFCSPANTGNYQDQNYPNGSPDSKNGGILTFAKAAGGNSAGGASSQYGAFSLGSIDDNSAAPGYGFYSAGALAAVAGTTPINMLSFAHSGTWGGLFDGSVRQGNCTPDYYSQRPTLASQLGVQLKNTINKGTDDGTYVGLDPTKFDGVGPPPTRCVPPLVYCLTKSDTTIAPGARMTIYVSGNVYIDRNITYAAHDANSVPKFALVVKGSIYIDPAVTRLDGLYIAQPDLADPTPVSSDTGDIWTCHPNVTGQLDYKYPPQCTNPLVVNGAFVAKQVMFMRVNGDIAGATTAEDGLGTVTACSPPVGSCNVAEVINYSPDLIMGGGFFNSSTSSGSTSPLQIDSIISLPPVF